MKIRTIFHDCETDKPQKFPHEDLRGEALYAGRSDFLITGFGEHLGALANQTPVQKDYLAALERQQKEDNSEPRAGATVRRNHKNRPHARPLAVAERLAGFLPRIVRPFARP